MTNVIATWSVSLDCTCPQCSEDFDVMDIPDFWDGRKLEIPESNTDRSRNIEVQCPKCDHEFMIDCEW